MPALMIQRARMAAIKGIEAEWWCSKGSMRVCWHGFILGKHVELGCCGWYFDMLTSIVHLLLSMAWTLL
jgi:hypothetical protein